MTLGKSNLRVSTVGVGVWAWGDAYWAYGGNYGKSDIESAYAELLPKGLTFIDTAEVYGNGKSEELLGEFVRKYGQANQLQVATKFAPLPWRMTSNTVEDALRASLKRLGLPKIQLYIIHWPGFFTETWLEGLADVQNKGLTEAVGVSNFSAKRTREAAAQLRKRGVALSSNQVQYSLLYRTAETNGMLEACLENGVTPVAYSPLAQGMLTGKYKVGDDKPAGPRSFTFTDDKLRRAQPLLGLMNEIGQARGGKTLTQISLNWVMCKGAVPIPGVKNVRQAQEVAGAMGWRLTKEEVAALDKASRGLTLSYEPPFEKW